jgi:DNA-binding GntR family transcriptional regulator
MQRSCLSRPHLGDVAQVRVMAELIYVRYISMTHLGPSARTASSARYELPELATYAPHRPAPASLSEKAYHLIRDRIVSLRLPPGSMIDERELVADLGLGRTPVREALRRLAGENLVDVFPRRGMFVAGVDVGDLASISEARAELEGFAARLAAARATKEERRVCEELVHELDSSRDETDARKLIYFDQRIHRHVYRCTHNDLLEATLEEYFVLTLRLWLVVIDRVERLDEAVQEHRELLEAIVHSDAESAEKVMRRHVVGFEEAIRAVL